MKKKNLKVIGDALRNVFAALEKEGYAYDAEEGHWITLSNGSAVELNGAGEVKKGMGGSQKGVPIKEAAKNMSSGTEGKSSGGSEVEKHTASLQAAKKEISANHATAKKDAKATIKSATPAEHAAASAVRKEIYNKQVNAKNLTNADAVKMYHEGVKNSNLDAKGKKLLTAMLVDQGFSSFIPQTEANKKHAAATAALSAARKAESAKKK